MGQITSIFVLKPSEAFVTQIRRYPIITFIRCFTAGVTLFVHTCFDLQVQMPIRDSVHLEHLITVMSMPPVLMLHLTCVPVTQPAATGVHAIQDTPGMDSPAQVK